MRYGPVIAVMALLASASVTIPAITTGPSKTTRDSVAEGLTCQCGCGLTVANCNHPNCEFSVPVRERIDRLIAKGMTGEQIIGIFRAQYGEKVLSAPTTQGFNLVAWLMPPFALIIGAILVMLTISRWRAARAAGDATKVPAPMPAGDTNPGLRRELARQVREGM